MAVNQQRRKGRMIHVDREVDMTTSRHHDKITQMLKDERLDERKPFSEPSSQIKHASPLHAIRNLDTQKRVSIDETKALMVLTPSMYTNLI